MTLSEQHITTTPVDAPPDRRWLILGIEAPLISFGGVMIDHIGATRDFPVLSMLTGLFANALGWKRTEKERHQALQDRLVFAARLDWENSAGRLTDSQNAQLEKTDRGWTTWGVPEGRAGASYGAPHRRRRDYHMDTRVTIVLRLEDGQAEPGLDRLADAIDRPQRPLFIGRKSCLPSTPLLAAAETDRFVLAPDAYSALARVAVRKDSVMKGGSPRLRAFWPLGEGPDGGEQVHRIHDLPDLRNWHSGLHGGVRKVVEGVVLVQGGAA